MRLLSGSSERVSDEWESDRALDCVLYRTGSSPVCTAEARLYCVRKSTFLWRYGIALCQEHWTDYIMSCVPVVVADSVGTCCGLHWIAFSRARARSLWTAFKRVISWQKNASLRFFLSLWLLPLKLFSIILGNAWKLYQVSLSKCCVGILRDSSQGNSKLRCFRFRTTKEEFGYKVKEKCYSLEIRVLII